MFIFDMYNIYVYVTWKKKKLNRKQFIVGLVLILK